MKELFFLLIITSCCVVTNFGQSSDYIFTNFTVRDGLPSNECYDVTQDKLGYIWVSTDNGIARFDGQFFRHYGRADGLEDNVIFRLEVDEKGRIWAGGIQDKFFIYSQDDDRFYPWKYNETLSRYKSNDGDYIRDFAVHDETITIMRARFGLLTIDKMGAVNIDTIVSSGGCQIVIKNGKSFMTNNYFDSSTESYSRIYNNDSFYDVTIPLPSKEVGNQFRTIYKDDICIVSIYGLTTAIEGSKIKWKRQEPIVNKFKLTQNGDLIACLGTNGGVRKYTDEARDEFETIISGISASNFHEDTKGGYWITSTDKGLFYIKNVNIEYLSEHHLNDYYTDVIVGDDEVIFTATYDGQLGVYNTKQNTCKGIFKSEGQEYKSCSYNRFNKCLYVSVANLFLRIDEKGNVEDTQSSVLPLHSRLFGSINDVYFEESLIHLIDNGRDYFTIEEAADNNILHDISEHGDDNIYRGNSLIKSKSNIVYVGDINGLQFKDLDKEIDFEADSNFIGLRIEDIIEDESGRLLLATKGEGLAVYDPANQMVQYINESHGLISNDLEDVEYQSDNVWWVASLSGISRIDLSDLNRPIIKNYSMSHGLPVPDVYNLACNDGFVYAATGQGVVKIKNETNKIPSVSPVINQIMVNNERVSLSNSIDLNYDQNAITIDYKTLNHAHARDQIYRYRLNEEDWTITNQSDLILTNLSPSRYKVEVQSENEDGIWSQSTSLSININPPWWNKWWFYILSTLFVISAIIYYFWKREQSIRKQEAIKDEMRSLEKAALQSQMNPHFIFNSLNSIQNFIMSNDKIAAMDYLSRFAKLIRLTLNASGENKITVHDEVQMLNHYLSLEKLRFKSRFEYEINVSTDVDEHSTFLPPMLIQPLVENAVKHGMSGVESGGKIEVRLGRSGDRLNILVKDNGSNPNIKKKENIDQNHQFSEEHKSQGMQITGKRLSMDSDIKVKEVEGWTEVEIWV